MKLVIVPLALAELNDAAAFYKARQMLSSVSRSSPSLNVRRVWFWKTPYSGLSFGVLGTAFFSAGFHTASFIRSLLKNCASSQWRIIGGVQATGPIASCKHMHRCVESRPTLCSSGPSAAAAELNRWAFKKMTARYLELLKEKPWNFLLS